MGYLLKANEPVPDGIKRVVSEEIKSAAEQLAQKSVKKREEAIHEARKSVKKIRGALRLVEPELGNRFADLNAQFRDIGRQLSALRDSAAILETFNGVAEKYADELPAPRIAPLRNELERQKHLTETSAETSKTLQQVSKKIRSYDRDVEKWSSKADGFGAIHEGLQLTYRRGRRAMNRAIKKPTSNNFHEWRKRAKDHWYHIRLLESLWEVVLQAHEASLKDLETWLGDDHNLVVLRAQIEEQPEKYGKAEDVALFLSIVERAQKELRENSIELGARIYLERPRRFTKVISKLWDTWKTEADESKAAGTSTPAKRAARNKTPRGQGGRKRIAAA